MIHTIWKQPTKEDGSNGTVYGATTITKNDNLFYVWTLKFDNKKYSITFIGITSSKEISTNITFDRDLFYVFGIDYTGIFGYSLELLNLRAAKSDYAIYKLELDCKTKELKLYINNEEYNDLIIKDIDFNDKHIIWQ